MLLFYKDCIKQGYITETTPLIVVGHSLGGALAQLFALSFATAENANIIKEVYTFNAPGAKTLQVPYNINPMPHYVIHFTKQDLLRDESINYKLNQALNEYYDVYLRYEGQSSTQDFERELEKQLWDKAYALRKEQGDNFHLGVYFDPFNAMLPYVTLLEQEEDYRHHFVLSYYHRLYKNYKERKPLASFKSTYHIETKDNAKDFIPVLGYPNNATQHLWTDIDGYYYAINIGGIIGIPSHYLKYAIRTLYFYLLELKCNDATIHRSIAYRKTKRTSANSATTNTTQNTHIDSTADNNTNTQTHDTLADYLHELNIFMDNIRIAMNILVYEIDKENQKKYEQFKKEQAWYDLFKKTPQYDDIDFLALLISQINETAYKLETLKGDSNTYLAPSIDKEHIIEALLEFIESNYLIQMLDNELLRTMRNQCQANAKSSIQEKLSLAACQLFSLANNKAVCYINEDNLHKIHGYKGLGDLLSQEWHKEFTNGKYKIAKGLYFGGDTYSSFTKYMIHDTQEKETIH